MILENNELWGEYYIIIIIHYMLFITLKCGHKIWERQKQCSLFIVQWEKEVNNHRNEQLCLETETVYELSKLVLRFILKIMYVG